MPKRLGVFVDVSNLYYCIRKKYQRKLDYNVYYDNIKDLGDIQQAIAYGAQLANEAQGFIFCLKDIGFTVKFKEPKTWQEGERTKRKADWDVGMTIDMVNMYERFDIVVLGSADGDLAPAVRWLRDKGVDVIVIASGISSDLKQEATKWIEIPESQLEPLVEETILETCEED